MNKRQKKTQKAPVYPWWMTGIDEEIELEPGWDMPEKPDTVDIWEELTPDETNPPDINDW